MSTPDEVAKARARRLTEVLERLATQGVNQQQAARELSVPPHYLSDLKRARRPMSEQFARRVADVFHISVSWLLHGEGSMDLPSVFPPPEAVAPTLPVLSAPCRGDPRESSLWDGSVVTLAGAAAAAAAQAQRPYVLRIREDDRRGRLRANDLVLCSQELREDATIAIVAFGTGFRLARRMADGRYEIIDSGEVFSAILPAGHCLAIVWAGLQNDRSSPPESGSGSPDR